MRYAWKNWKPQLADRRLSPYVHWRVSREKFKSGDANKGLEFKNNDLNIEIFKLGPFSVREPEDMARARSHLANSYGDLMGAALILPSYARNRGFKYSGWEFDPEQLPEPPPADSVIVGVIDSGIALGHRRLQHADGSTRILSAWQQSAKVRPDQPRLPFGSELYSADIDKLLREHRPDGPGGAFDEDAFNRAAGLVEMQELYGHRELALRAAHGAHVLDIAAGFDPGSEDESVLKRLPVIAVNLPSRTVVGLSGSFLEFFVVLAIDRIAALCDALYKKGLDRGGRSGFREKGGYRILINFSFGKSAGSRDGKSLFHAYLNDLNAREEGSKVEIVMPAGNDNLKRGHAQKDLRKDEELDLLWRVLPEDRSSNYLEIWSDELSSKPGQSAADQIEIKVTPPGQPTLEFVAGKDGSSIDLGDGVARIYCTEKRVDDATSRVQYVICTSPTYSSAPGSVTAPAGLWHIAVTNRAGEEKRVFFCIQTDQSANPTAATGLRSYFEDDSYQRHDETGRLVDSFSYEPDCEGEFLDKGRLVRRHGSLNALAHYNGVAVVGGYRLSDGRPADYSGTGHETKLFGKESRGAPTCSLPSDDGAAHFGRLGAGSRDGSTVRLRGTSFAAAQATRHVALVWLADPSRETLSARKVLFDDAKSGDPKVDPNGCREVDIEKVGGGRLKPPDTGYLNRIRNTWSGR